MSTRISVTEQVNRVIVEEDVVRVISAGGVGPPGPQGPAGTLPTTTLGDMIVHGASGATRLAVGSNGQALTVAAGVPAWGAVSGGSAGGLAGYPPWISGRYYSSAESFFGYNVSASTATLDAGVMFFMPLRVPVNLTIDEIACNVETASAAGGKLRMGIYSLASGSPRPGTLVLDSGEVAVDTTGVKAVLLGTPLAITAGVYWLAVLASLSTGLTGYAGVSAAPPQLLGFAGVGTLSNVSTPWLSQAYGPLPATVNTANNTWGALYPRIAVRRA